MPTPNHCFHDEQILFRDRGGGSGSSAGTQVTCLVFPKLKLQGFSIALDKKREENSASYGSQIHHTAPKPQTRGTGFGERPAPQCFGNKLRPSGSIASGDQKPYGAVCVGTRALTNTTRLQQGPIRARTYWARSHRSQEPQHSAASSAQGDGRQGNSHVLKAYNGAAVMGSAVSHPTTPNTSVS